MKLREWKTMNKSAGSTTNSSSSSYKKRFEKLIKYHIDHASSELESINKKEINDYSFHLGEHYNDGNNEFNRTIVVGYSNTTKIFTIYVYVDGREVTRISRKSYEDLVSALKHYMFLPDGGTQEYDDLLAESLNEWKTMNPSTSSKTSQPTQSFPQPAPTSNGDTAKFYEIIYFMNKHRSSEVINTQASNLSDNGFEYEEQRESPNGRKYTISVKVEYKHSAFYIKVFMDGRKIEESMLLDWKELLRALKAYFNAPYLGTPEYTNLTESALADDFRLYETLWD
jgi:hypothetical protein